MDITLGEYYVYCIISIVNAQLFIFILIKYGHLFKSNIYAMFVIVCIAIYSLEPFWMWELIVKYPSSSYNDRCTISGFIHTSVAKINVACILLMLIKILEINFQPFPLLAYPKAFIIALKTFVIAVFIFASAIPAFTIPLKYSVHQLQNDQNRHICHLSTNNISTSQSIVSVIAFSLYIVCIVSFWLLFIRKINKLYRVTTNNTGIKDQKKTKQNMKIIVIPMIRQTILVSSIIIAATFWIISHGILVLQPFANLATGLCVVLMFSSQSQPWFSCLCGCLEKKLIRKWIKVKIASLREKVDASKEVNINMVNMNVSPDHNNSVQGTLSAIKEDEITLTLPKDHRWSSSILYECGPIEEDIVPESITPSDLFTAMMALELTEPSITIMTD